MLKTRFLFAAQLMAGCLVSLCAVSQPTWTLDPFGKEKKPKEYEEKKLPSERTGEKKFTKLRRFTQNTTTHYNYFFNANNRLNAVVERAKMAQKDDFSKLLSFYPYSLENTSAEVSELDSVIYKATSGILLHDLRSDWVDNMYLLIGKSYYLRNQMDSAAMSFQFINYNLFPRKKNEDDSRVVGTNNSPGSGGLSIANAEKRNFVNKMMSRPPSRNDALVWMARTFTTQGEYGDAAGLINILRNDPNLPQRLQNDLAEVTAYWFFVQNNYDSAALHLERGLSAATNKQDQARWEFLLAQMNEMNGHFDEASDFYARSAKHTVDPVMEIFANLNDAKMLRNKGDLKQMDATIARLLKMAKKDKYEGYRDIIYYSTAQISLQKPDTSNSIGYLQKSLKYNENNTEFKNKSFLQLADIAYSRGDFQNAHDYYDSLQLNDLDSILVVDITERKGALVKLVGHLNAIAHEDSLQRIAALNETEREAHAKKILRKLRKEQGLKEEDAGAGTGAGLITFGNNKNESVDLFSSQSKGEWYFYNNTARSKGYQEFVGKWGKRANTDNWRRKKPGVGGQSGPGADPDKQSAPKPGSDSAAVAELSVASLLQNLPLTAEKMDSSNKRIEVNMLELGKVFQNDMLEYQMAIEAYENYLQRFPAAPGEPEAYLGLYYCYSKLGNTARADFYKNLLTNKHANSNAGKLITNPSLLNPNLKTEEGTRRYESIYNLFIEGKFSEALQAKKSADSLYGSNYWTPQMLYIEAVYHIREKQDSTAIAVLNNLVSIHPGSELTPKARTLIDVLGRRAAIEEYLTKLEVVRQEEELIVVADEKPVQQSAPVVAAPVKVEPVKTGIVSPVKRDSSQAVKPVAEFSGFVIQPEKPHVVLMLLDKVDYVYVNEAKNAFTRFNKSSYVLQNIEVVRDNLDANMALLVFNKFEDSEAAMKYFDKVKKAAPSEVSWLAANKYSFIIISESNLQLLKTNKDLEGYKKILNASFGNKF